MKRVYILLILFLATMAVGNIWAEKLPELSLMDAKGQKQTIKGGQNVLILAFLDFTESTAGPVLPALNIVSARFARFNPQVLAVHSSLEDESVVLDDLKKDLKLDFPLYRDHDREALRRLNTGKVPVTFVVDNTGEIICKVEGTPSNYYDRVANHVSLAYGLLSKEEVNTRLGIMENVLPVPVEDFTPETDKAEETVETPAEPKTDATKTEEPENKTEVAVTEENKTDTDKTPENKTEVAVTEENKTDTDKTPENKTETVAKTENKTGETGRNNTETKTETKTPAVAENTQKTTPEAKKNEQKQGTQAELANQGKPKEDPKTSENVVARNTSETKGETTPATKEQEKPVSKETVNAAIEKRISTDGTPVFVPVMANMEFSSQTVGYRPVSWGLTHSPEDVVFFSFVDLLVKILPVVIWFWGMLYCLGKTKEYRGMMLAGLGCFGFALWYTAQLVMQAPPELCVFLPVAQGKWYTAQYYNWLAGMNLDSFIYLALQIFIIAGIAGQIKQKALQQSK